VTGERRTCIWNISAPASRSTPPGRLVLPCPPSTFDGGAKAEKRGRCRGCVSLPYCGVALDEMQLSPGCHCVTLSFHRRPERALVRPLFGVERADAQANGSLVLAVGARMGGGQRKSTYPGRSAGGALFAAPRSWKPEFASGRETQPGSQHVPSKGKRLQRLWFMPASRSPQWPVAPGTPSTPYLNGLNEVQDTLAGISKGLMMVRQIASLRGGRKGQGRGRGRRGCGEGPRGRVDEKRVQSEEGLTLARMPKRTRAKKQASMGIPQSQGPTNAPSDKPSLALRVARCRCVAHPAARRRFLPGAENLLLAKNTSLLFPSSETTTH
jgi:hypothetical protein